MMNDEKEVLLGNISLFKYDGKITLTVESIDDGDFDYISVDKAKEVIEVLSTYIKENEDFSRWKEDKDLKENKE